MTDNPYVTLSSATSLDGHIDTADPPRLTLPNDADFDRVDGVRARNDLTATGDLDPCAAFFTAGDTTKLVYCPTPAAERIRRRVRHTALVVGLGGDMVLLRYALSDRFTWHDAESHNRLMTAPLVVRMS